MAPTPPHAPSVSAMLILADPSMNGAWHHPSCSGSRFAAGNKCEHCSKEVSEVKDGCGGHLSLSGRARA